MSPNRIVGCAAIAVFVVGFGVGSFVVARVQHARAALAEAQHENAVLRAERDDWERKAREAEQRVSLLEQRAAATAAARRRSD